MSFKFLGVKPPKCSEGHSSGMICIDREAAEHFRGALQEVQSVLRVWRLIKKNEFVEMFSITDNQWVKKCNETGVPHTIQELGNQLRVSAGEE